MTTQDRVAIHGCRFTILGNTTGTLIEGGASTFSASLSGTSPGLFTLTIATDWRYPKLVAGPYASLEVAQGVASDIWRIVPVSSSLDARTFQFLVTSGSMVSGTNTNDAYKHIPNGVMNAVVSATASVYFVARNTTRDR